VPLRGVIRGDSERAVKLAELGPGEGRHGGTPYHCAGLVEDIALEAGIFLRGLDKRRAMPRIFPLRSFRPLIFNPLNLKIR
jgi:hypothetical protein